MMNQSLHDYVRHLLAALFGLPITICILALIPFLSAVSYQLPQIAPVMVVDLVETPKQKTPATKKPVKPTPEKIVKPKPQPKKTPPRTIVKKQTKVRRKVPKNPDQPSLKASLKKRPEENIDEQVQKEIPVAPQPSEVEPEPIPTPIFKLSSMPRFLHREAPVYPENMKKMGRSATVKLKALIDKTGKVRRVIVEKSAGLEFDKAAVTAVKKSSFIPGMQEGKPVAVMLRLPVRFRLL